ncbi:Alpha/Beta hydrolase protein [Mycena vulgaris]|nr:Alpha/Beta hydrolase protein [Mycena vulgaris]
MSSSPIHLAAPAPSASPRVKPPPSTTAIPVPFFYAPSDDGTDENLLILLHGLGDTHAPFAALARQLRLPQTAVLALRAPDPLPFLYADAYAWFPAFSLQGEPLPAPAQDPSPALALLARVLAHLTRDCAWPPARVHLFGFAQGGTLAAEFALSVSADDALGSVVSVCGPLLSYPTRAADKRCPTPLLVAYRPSSGGEDDDDGALPAVTPAALAALRKGFASVREHPMPARNGAGMPASKPEWEPIMRFWSERLTRRRAEGLYEVLSGGPA